MLFRTSTNTTTKCADQNQQASKPVAQNTTKNYLYRPALQALLEKLFPDQTDFSIEVCQPYPKTCLESKYYYSKVDADW